MGLFDKIKNIFYDEEIVEVPEHEEIKIKDESKKPKIEEIKTPKKEIIKEEVEETKSNDLPISEREIFKSATPTFKFPVLENDEDEPLTRTKIKSNILNDKPIIKEPKRKEPVVVEERPKRPEGSFKPSPVISPVYGILDKNYKKEEIVEKKEPTYRPRTSEMNYDYVRRKAYGTLEDEIENTLTTIGLEVEEIEEKPATKSIQELISEINDNANLSVGELEEKIKDKFEEIEEELEDDSEITQEFYYKKETKKLENELEEVEETEVEEEEEEILPKREKTIEDIGDKTLEHDLFNLIDSMYEDKEEE